MKHLKISKPVSVVYFVKDITKVRNWYAQVLDKSPYRDDKDFIAFRIGNYALCFHKADVKSDIAGCSQVAYWKVTDLKSTITVLKEYGAKVYRNPIVIPEGGRVMQMKDPFGNIIGLTE